MSCLGTNHVRTISQPFRPILFFPHSSASKIFIPPQIQTPTWETLMFLQHVAPTFVLSIGSGQPTWPWGFHYPIRDLISPVNHSFSTTSSSCGQPRPSPSSSRGCQREPTNNNLPPLYEASCTDGVRKNNIILSRCRRYRISLRSPSLSIFADVGNNAVYLSFDAINFLSISCPAVPVQSKILERSMPEYPAVRGRDKCNFISEIEKLSYLLAPI